ncbi:ribosomal protein S18-alanine N-acetyltransferase [Streptococcus didelphis]|uniref:[Ribosomal protein bS18]-alanine N-acetyltransferase n=1 Tax=Streptococcus didelphis TaxID=102886 RepID=A0ABY9LG11_9STRE|nr:ribosomal protein S18-alanine N-acetyltransferase [Streptococcus didelphis]WMB27784.1 ribosomal protein S18-alanine N-acetyltransferase [Streptococcus didelphis]WMB29756.1 ribosomal protein S18-alanine N-acetyltransferase [Streptococcus didelphis]
MDEVLRNKVTAIAAILQDVYGTSPWTKDQIQADLLSDQVDYFFVYREEKIVGFLSLQHLVGEMEITHIAVLKAFQGQGLAKKLLEKIRDVQLPIFLEVRESNLVAQTLYQHFGFVEIAKRKNYYHNPLETALIMKRDLKNDR